MKRIIAVFLILCCLINTFACAESGGGLLDGIGSWFSRAWEDTSKWVEQAWKDTSEWAEQAWKDASAWFSGAWGDASEWIEQAWKEVSPKLNEIWGDVSAWAAGTYESVSGSVSAWWADTFKDVTEAKDRAWGWIRETSADLGTQAAGKYQEVVSLIQNGSTEAGESVEEVFADLLKKLKLNDGDISKVLDTVKVYAQQREIAVESVEKVMLPYLVQLTEDGSKAQNGQIPAVAVAQYLTGIMVEEGIGTEEDAQRMLNTMKETLNVQ